MSPSMPRSLPDDPILIHAYVDGELDPIDALEMKRRIADDPALATECERIEALRHVMRRHPPRAELPPGLRARVERAVGVQNRAQPPSWRALAASVALAAFVASGSTWLTLYPHQADVMADTIVAAHIRGLIAPSATDVTSSDTHTVKPWFSGRIPQAPRVLDLSPAGFPLSGGRIDVIGRSPSPTLVYSRRKHVISVTAVTAPDMADVEPRQIDAQGYNVVNWIQNGVSYWATSDLNANELAEFVNLFRNS
jgi:anti-sigma factor RsiW